MRQKYDVKKIAFDFEKLNALTELFFDVKKIAFDRKRLNALTKLFDDVKKIAFDFEQSNALTKLFNRQIAAFDCDIIKCALTIIFGENSLQLIDCNVLRSICGVNNSRLKGISIFIRSIDIFRKQRGCDL